jgi:hypothetical protein
MAQQEEITTAAHPIHRVTWDETCSPLLDSLVDPKYSGRHAENNHNIFLFSHRRSGTHMTINLLRYGFQNVTVWKTNHASCSNCSLISMLQACGGTVVHVYRNPLDVAVSLHDYMKGFDPAAKNLTLDEFVQRSSVATKWNEYTRDCMSAPGVVQVEFELVRTNPKRAFALLQHLLGLEGHWQEPAVPHDGAVSYKGGRINGWSALSDGTLRDFMLNITSAGYTEECACDKGRPIHSQCSVIATPF